MLTPGVKEFGGGLEEEEYMKIHRGVTGKIALSLLAPLETLLYRMRMVLFLTGLAIFALSVMFVKTVQAENLIFRYITVNPSADKTQEILVKKYLPSEVTPDTIVDLGGMELEYDTEKST